MKSIFSTIVMSALLAFAVSCNNGGNQNSKVGDSVVPTSAPANPGQPAPAAQDSSQTSVNNQPVNTALPQAAQNYINQILPGKEIASVNADDDDFTVMLKSGEKLEFDLQGNIKEIEAYNGVPAAAIDSKIINDVKTTDPQAVIVKFDRNVGGYEVKLNNGMEIKYSADGKRLMAELDD